MINLTDKNSVLLLKEVQLHPNSMLIELSKRFEKPSIIRVFGKESLRQYRNRPVYDNNYLVIFEHLNLFESNINSIDLEFMLPVVLLDTTEKLNDAKRICENKSIPYLLYINEFDRTQAYSMIRSLASEEVSDNFCKTLVSRVGLNPQRIISSMMVCQQVGYNTSKIGKYIDKYTFISVYDVIYSLLGVCSSVAQCKRAALYLHQNRLWFNKFTRSLLVKELDLTLMIFKNLLDGSLTAFNLQSYSENNKIPSYKIMYGIKLSEKVSFNEVLSLRYFLDTASLLEVALRLS